MSEWLRGQTAKSKTRGYVIGLSGGVDSTAACGLCVDAVGKKNVLGILLPSQFGYGNDVDDGIAVANHFGIKYITHPIGTTYESICIFNNINISDIAKGNVQARLRMTILRMYAEFNSYLVCGTTNKSEDILGYFTKGGDGGSGVDVEPMSDFYKSEIVEIVKYYGLPDSLAFRTPSAGLWAGQTDEGELGFTYDDFEKYWRWRESRTDEQIMARAVAGEGYVDDVPVDISIEDKILYMYRATKHKRDVPPKYIRK